MERLFQLHTYTMECELLPGNPSLGNNPEAGTTLLRPGVVALRDEEVPVGEELSTSTSMGDPRKFDEDLRLIGYRVLRPVANEKTAGEWGGDALSVSECTVDAFPEDHSWFENWQEAVQAAAYSPVGFEVVAVACPAAHLDAIMEWQGGPIDIYWNRKAANLVPSFPAHRMLGYDVAALDWWRFHSWSCVAREETLRWCRSNQLTLTSRSLIGNYRVAAQGVDFKAAADDIEEYYWMPVALLSVDFQPIV